jgi:hypothetical protein
MRDFAPDAHQLTLREVHRDLPVRALYGHAIRDITAAGPA